MWNRRIVINILWGKFFIYIYAPKGALDLPMANVFTYTWCVYLIEGVHAHICQRQMCLPAPEGAHAHICRSQMCLPAPEGAHVHIC